MNDTHRTKAELIKELEALRQQVARWEETESNSRYAEEAPKEGQKRYGALIENSPFGVWEINPDGTTIYINQAMCAMLEIESPEDLNGKTYHSFFTPQSLETIAKEHAKRYQGVASSYEVEIIGNKGRKRKVLIHGTLVSSSKGELKSLIGIFIDVAERNLAVENLRKWAYIFEYADWGVGIVGAEGKTLVLINPAFARMHGYTEEELIGRPIIEVFAPECRDDVPKQIWMADEKNHHIPESKHIRKDGTVFPVQMDITIVKDKGGMVQFRAVHIQDITERMQAEKEVKETVEKLRKAMEGIIQAMALTVETRDPYTAGHQRRVADLARSIAQEMGLPEDQVDGLRMAAHVHDLGKIGVPAEILSKPTELNSIEFNLIKIHPQISYNILKDIDFPWPVAQIVFQHHERINGSGYPLGLSGEDICLEARILAVADVVEATSSHRPYRPAHGIDEALEEISQNKGILYDPEVVDVCLRFFREKGFRFN